MIQMQRDGQAGLQDRGFHQLDQIIVLGIFAGAGGHLQDHRGIFQLCGLCNALYDLHIIHIESANGVTALIGFFEHFFCADQRHSVLLLLYP